MSDNIKVVVKVRPLIDREIREKLSKRWRVHNNTLYKICEADEDSRSFSFDKVYDEDAKTIQVYDDIAKPIVEAATAGINGTIFAYGQTSSGKTYTMTGSHDSPGIIPLAVYNIFDIIEQKQQDREFLLRVSYIEIYNEIVRDLLDNKKEVKISETRKEVRVKAHEIVASSPEEVLDIMKKGESIRETGATNMNESSSRSHSIFQITIESREKSMNGPTDNVNISVLNLVDLAGSERAGQTGATGTRLKEGTHINLSLSVLAHVINQLSERNKFANFRDSKLTRILQNSLGGNAKTSIICAVTMAAIEETISTLQFATRAKSIENDPKVNAVTNCETMIQQLTKRLDQLTKHLESKKNLEKDNQNLQRQIEQLKKQILNRDPAAGQPAASRKVAPRRATIHALSSINENDVLLNTFHTPALKYNPNVLGNMSYLPLPTEPRNSRISEESSGMITPPPIIEINSDDEDKATECSPFHQCHESTVTPPCVLKRRAQEAEQNLKEVQEMANLEKMYPPDVSELLTKISQNTEVINKLNAQVQDLSEKCEEKNGEVLRLSEEHIRIKEDCDKKIAQLAEEKSQIQCSVEKIVAEKVQIQKSHEEVNIKLTDLEVSYETLKNKYKTREAELLSLIKEIDKGADNNKRNLVNMSNVSDDLVSVSSSKDEGLGSFETLLTDVQSQLSNKNMLVDDLEAQLNVEREKVMILQQKIDELQHELAISGEHSKKAESEIDALKQETHKYNSIISSQKDMIASATQELQSYYDIVAELQNKVSEKETQYKILEHDVLENVLDTEEVCKNNLAKLKNIVSSVKTAIDIKNKEINLLQAKVTDLSSNNLEIDSKEDQILKLKQEIEQLNEDLNSSRSNLFDMTKKYDEICTKNYDLKVNLDEYSQKVAILEQEIALKQDLIVEKESLNATCLSKLLCMLKRIEEVISKLNETTSDSQQINEHDSDIVLSILDKNLLNLSSIVADLCIRKYTNTELVEKYQADIKQLQAEIESLEITTANNNQKALLEREQLMNDVQTLQKELNRKNKLDEENVITHNKISELNKVLIEKENTITELMENVSMLNSELNINGASHIELIREFEDLSCNIINLLSTFSSLRLISDSEYNLIKESIDKCEDLKHKNLIVLKAIEEAIKSYSKLTDNVKVEIINLNNSYNETSKLAFENSNLFDIIKQLPIILKDIFDFSVEKHKLECSDSIAEANSKIYEITSRNMELQKEVAEYSEKYAEAFSEIKIMKSSLYECSSLIESLQKELKDKVLQFETLEMNAKSIKEKSAESEKLFQQKTENLLFDNNIQTSNTKNEEKSIQTVPESLKKISFSKLMSVMALSLDTHSPQVDKAPEDCGCDSRMRLKSSLTKIETLKNTVDFLRLANKDLIEERQSLSDEIRDLVEPAIDLHKKVANHRSNLSLLTASTHAENKILKTKLKALQHYHTKLHNICQKDIIVFKSQLQHLFEVLKNQEYKQNIFKRYSLPEVFDKNMSVSTLKNESSFDADLLMLDTNVTIATTADDTLVGHDNTCFDLTQLKDNETTEKNECINDHIKIQLALETNEKLNTEINLLREENIKIKTEIEDLRLGQIGSYDLTEINCETCKNLENYQEEESRLAEKLTAAIDQKQAIEKSFFEVSERVKVLENECKSKSSEIVNIKNDLARKQAKIESMVEEIDILSTQLIDSITEADSCKSELDKIREELKMRDVDPEVNVCQQCKLITTGNASPNQSQLDVDTSLRHNRISTLRNELHVSQEDCKKITEEFATIKNHLTNLSLTQNMDMEGNISDSNIFTFTKNLEAEEQQATKDFEMNVNLVDRSFDYSNDKTDCVNYIVEKTGSNKENLNHNMKMIDLLRYFYNNLVLQHSNAIENLMNKLRDCEEKERDLKLKVQEITISCTEISKESQEKAHLLESIRSNVSVLSNEIRNSPESYRNTSLVEAFKEKILKILDEGFSTQASYIFESLIDTVTQEHHNDVSNMMKQYNELKEKMESVVSELTVVNENLEKMKNQLIEKEKEYNMLKTQNDKVHEINSAVTLDIVMKEKELTETVHKNYHILIEKNILHANDFTNTEPLHKKLSVLFDRLVEHDCLKDSDSYSTLEKEKDDLVLEIKKSKTLIEEKDKEIDLLKLKNERVSEISNCVTLDLIKKDNALKQQISLSKEYEDKLEELHKNLEEIDNLKLDIMVLKETVKQKEAKLETLETSNNLTKDNEVRELMEKTQLLQEELTNVKKIADIVNEEKSKCSLELEKCKEIITVKNSEIEKLTADAILLKQTVADTKSQIDTMATEAKNLLAQIKTLGDNNVQLTSTLNELNEKYNKANIECTNLKHNIKTHEKTAQVQTKIINRLKTQRESDQETIKNKNQTIDELTQKFDELQKEYDELKLSSDQTKNDMNDLLKLKDRLEVRVTQLESETEDFQKRRISLGREVKSRRQSIHDSKRTLIDDAAVDHVKMETIFSSRPKPDDLFNAIEDSHSNRSTPVAQTKRESLLSKTGSDDDPPSRPSSVNETRRKRQSFHDRRRDSLHHGNSPVQVIPSKGTDEVTQLKATIVSYEQEIKELQERNNELDKECEICAEYIQEWEQQCVKLKEEKKNLLKNISDLKEQLANSDPNIPVRENRTAVSIAVNTEEDWANLHSVVVDRMSFDAEKEKNKKLSKAVEEFRLKNRELKTMYAKLERAYEKNISKDNAAVTKELAAVSQAWKDLKEKYDDLELMHQKLAVDLRDTEEHCRKLKKDNYTLENKLEELRKVSSSQSARKKRQTMHDEHRDSNVKFNEGEGTSYQAERDTDQEKTAIEKEVQRLRKQIDNLTTQNAALGERLANPQYVSTGSAIVQNQQLTDILRENEKLKRVNAKLCKMYKAKKENIGTNVAEQV